RPVPRPESYREDVELAHGVEREAPRVYEDLRAACESGWDFSSRWFKDGQYLASIHTTDIIPVDLNALLHHLELVLVKAYELKADEEKAEFYRQRAANRKRSLLKHCWSAEKKFFVDYDFIQRAPTEVPSLAALFPLYFNLASPEQAAQVAQRVQQDFLKAGGVLTTLNETGQQWDAPNGWAPLQWVTIRGLRNYGHLELAEMIKRRWINLNVKVYKNTGKMVEKYNVMDMALEAGGGEYPVQDGFGWTNGILLRLLMEDQN
ncbi:MAG: trehalase family glycosidase, partial [Bacteroidota bacterium]